MKKKTVAQKRSAESVKAKKVKKTVDSSAKVKAKVASKVKKTTEEFKVKGEKLLEKVKNLIKEGNVRKITIKDKSGKTLVEFPLTIGVVGVVLAPILAAVGALAALVGECTISVERR